MVRLSPAERADLAQKAALAGETLSGGMRAALAAWNPELTAIRNPTPREGSAIRVEYDE